MLCSWRANVTVHGPYVRILFLYIYIYIYITCALNSLLERPVGTIQHKAKNNKLPSMARKTLNIFIMLLHPVFSPPKNTSTKIISLEKSSNLRNMLFLVKVTTL